MCCEGFDADEVVSAVSITTCYLQFNRVISCTDRFFKDSLGCRTLAIAACLSLTTCVAREYLDLLWDTVLKQTESVPLSFPTKRDART